MLFMVVVEWCTVAVKFMVVVKVMVVVVEVC